MYLAAGCYFVGESGVDYSEKLEVECFLFIWLHFYYAHLIPHLHYSYNCNCDGFVFPFWNMFNLMQIPLSFFTPAPGKNKVNHRPEIFSSILGADGHILSNPNYIKYCATKLILVPLALPIISPFQMWACTIKIHQAKCGVSQSTK